MSISNKITLLFFSLLLVSIINPLSYSQVKEQWRSSYNGSASDTDAVTAMKVDNLGNVYVTGYSIGSGTKRDFATIKYNSTGVQLWAARYNNSAVNGDDIASAIEVDASGNVYVTGYSFGNGTFDDYLTIKYSPSGEQLWISRYNGKGNDGDNATAIEIDGSGNVYVTGFSVGSFTSEDFTTIKYNSAGAEQWIAFYNNNEADDIDIATSIKLDGAGNIYVAGYSIGTGSAEDYATVKYNPGGDEIWAVRYNGDANSYDITSALDVDLNGNVYVTGYSMGNGTAEDYATVKYNTDGIIQWVNIYNGISNDYDISSSIALDNSGNAYVTGYSYNSTSSEDYATIKYNSAGVEEWISKYNGTGGDYDIANTVKADNSGNVYVTGYSYDNISGDNYATIKYNTNGDEQWVEIFNGIANGSDIATYLDLDGTGNVYVTGYSYEGATNIDYVTIKYSQTVGISSNSNTVPDEFILKQNYPNPFNPSTMINYELRVANYVLMKVYDVLGNEVVTLVNEKQSAGSYSVDFNAGNFPSGIYFYSMTINGINTVSKRMILLK